MNIFSTILENQYLLSLSILAGGLILAIIIRIVLTRYIRKLFAKTKTDLDDKIFRVISAPVFYYIVAVAIYFALQYSLLLTSYEKLIDQTFFVISALFVAKIINGILRVLIHSWMRLKNETDNTPKLVENIVSVTVYVLALVLILNNFGVQIGPILAALGVGGLAVGLALKDTLSNIFSGVYIISDQPVRVGDYVEFGNHRGYIEDIGWRTSKIRTLRNDIVVIPNTQLAESVIINHDLIEKETNFTVECGIGYDMDLDKVEQIAMRAATEIQNELEEAVSDHEPSVRFNEFGDSNINFFVVLRAFDFSDKAMIASEFIKRLKKHFDKENIEISYPVRKVINK